MKKIRFWLATIAVLLCSVPVSAYNFEVDGIYYNITSETDLTVEVTYRNSNSYTGVVVIPERVTYNDKNYSVTSIGSSAFRDCRGLTSVTFGNSVTSIGGGAFDSCSGLTSITVDENNTTYDSRDNCNAIIETSSNELIVGCKSTVIPNSVTSIGGWAFSGHSGLTSITIPNSVTSIGDHAFAYCSSLTSITIPNSVTSIGNWVFFECTRLKSATIPNSVTSIGEWAFSGCDGLTSITIPNSVTSIGERAFDCSGLTSITVDENNTTYDSRDNCNAIIETSSNELIVGCKSTVIPNSVTSIGNYAFFGYSSLTSITIPNSVTSIGERAFSDCDGLTSIAIPNSVTSIGNWAFHNCRGLTSVTIGNSVTFIGKYAFSSCSRLTSATIGNSVTSIGERAFNACTNLNTLTIGAKIPPTVNNKLGLGSKQYDTVKLQVPEGSKAMYQSADEWKKFFNIEEFDPATGIADITPDAEDYNLPIYNLQGARMTEDRENLPTGIYIQGGKKIFIK